MFLDNKEVYIDFAKKDDNFHISSNGMEKIKQLLLQEGVIKEPMYPEGEFVITYDTDTESVDDPDGVIDMLVKYDEEYTAYEKKRKEFQAKVASLLEEIEPVWKATKGGKITKRIANKCKAVLGIKLEDAVVERIGYIAKENADDFRGYVVISDLAETDGIFWNQGDFGDSGSCFWGGHSQAKQIINLYFFSMRFYASKEAYKANPNRGAGRAWAALTENGFYIFNTYGSGLQPITFAKKLAIKLEELYPGSYEYSEIPVSNRGSEHFYMNSSALYGVKYKGTASKGISYSYDFLVCQRCGGTFAVDSQNVKKVSSRLLSPDSCPKCSKGHENDPAYVKDANGKLIPKTKSLLIDGKRYHYTEAFKIKHGSLKE